jgi:hypothetical protein
MLERVRQPLGRDVVRRRGQRVWQAVDVDPDVDGDGAGPDQAADSRPQPFVQRKWRYRQAKVDLPPKDDPRAGEPDETGDVTRYETRDETRDPGLVWPGLGDALKASDVVCGHGVTNGYVPDPTEDDRVPCDECAAELTEAAS